MKKYKWYSILLLLMICALTACGGVGDSTSATIDVNSARCATLVRSFSHTAPLI